MLATLFVYAAWLQEAATSWDLRSMWISMGSSREDRRRHSVHSFGLFVRRDD